ncbi:alkaline phosphatase D family protein [Leptolyngbya sp. 15MV]|nr:alkaline phosphatase D family protein [Leptolyngbya sp. 15MV]
MIDTAPSAASLPAASIPLSRRNLFRLGALGAAGLAAPVAARDWGTGFTHGVASGEPGQDRVMLWTRHAGAAEVALEWQVAEDAAFTRVVSGGSALASPERDWCAKVVAGGLAPGRWYYYRFIAPGGTMSDVGRTRTLPEGPVPRWRMAVFSCANIGFGWFNAYAHAAEADAFDLAVHTGDYLYEYPEGSYPDADQRLPGRAIWPAHEIVQLADYRLRHATYRADPDLRRLMQLYPMVLGWDDHESANDSWHGGAENHQPETEGSWDARKAAAIRAYREWLPVSDEPWAAYEIGDLATMFRLETRLTARSQPPSLAELARGAASRDVEGARVEPVAAASPVEVQWCRDAEPGQNQSVYRADASTDSYLIALGDNGNAVSVARDNAAALLDTDQRGRSGRYAITLITAAENIGYVAQDRLPSPQHVIELLKAERRTIAVNTWGEDQVMTVNPEAF